MSMFVILSIRITLWLGEALSSVSDNPKHYNCHADEQIVFNLLMTSSGYCNCALYVFFVDWPIVCLLEHYLLCQYSLAADPEHSQTQASTMDKLILHSPVVALSIIRCSLDSFHSFLL
jgi:hypothetical protein